MASDIDDAIDFLRVRLLEHKVIAKAALDGGRPWRAERKVDPVWRMDEAGGWYRVHEATEATVLWDGIGQSVFTSTYAMALWGETCQPQREIAKAEAMLEMLRRLKTSFTVHEQVSIVMPLVRAYSWHEDYQEKWD